MSESELRDAILGLVDSMGCLDSREEQAERDVLVKSLRRLLMETRPQSSLVAREDLATQVRKELHQRLEHLNDELLDVNECALEVAANSHNNNALKRTAAAVVVKFRNQIIRERRLIHSCMDYMNHLYDNDSDLTVPEDLDLLQRSALVTDPLVRVCTEFAVDNDDTPLFTSSSSPLLVLDSSLTDRIDAKEELPLLTPSSPQYHHDDLESIVQAFRQDQLPGLTTHCIVGAPGFGKSHTCRQIQKRLEDSSIPGM